MKIIDDIIEILSSKEKNLTTALLKTKVLLYKLGEKNLIKWINNEIEGYKNIKDLPDYRILNIGIFGNCSNMAYQATNQRLPLHHLTEEQLNNLTIYKFVDSISTIEEWGKDKEMKLSFPPEYNILLSKGLGNGYQVENSWGLIPSGKLTEIITTVSSRLLDFLLELSEKFPNNIDDYDIKNKISDSEIKDLFNNTVFGNNTTIILGSENKLNIKNSNKKNNFADLTNLLKEYNVKDEDIKKLKIAIEEDPIPEENKFGENVSNWIGNMVSKSASAIWEIEVSIAGSLLSNALLNFYGFSK